MDIFQALGIAGDLTINGKRNDIRITFNQFSGFSSEKNILISVVVLNF